MTPDSSPASGEQAKIKSPQRFKLLTLIATACVFFVAGMTFSHGLTRVWHHQASVWRALAMDYKARYENEQSEHAQGDAEKWQGLVENPPMPPLTPPNAEPDEPDQSIRILHRVI